MMDKAHNKAATSTLSYTQRIKQPIKSRTGQDSADRARPAEFWFSCRSGVENELRKRSAMVVAKECQQGPKTQ